MRTSKVFAVLGAAWTATMLAGCSSQASFSQSDINAIKNHQTSPMPAGVAEMNAQKMKDGQALYQQRLKEAGQLGANGMRKGEGPPAGTPSGPPPGAVPGTPNPR